MPSIEFTASWQRQLYAVITSQSFPLDIRQLRRDLRLGCLFLVHPDAFVGMLSQDARNNSSGLSAHKLHIHMTMRWHVAKTHCPGHEAASFLALGGFFTGVQ